MTKLRPKQGKPPDPPPEGLVLGRGQGAGLGLPRIGDLVIFPFEYLAQHLILIGKTGWGKTYTVWRLMDEIARRVPNAQIFFLDGAADPFIARIFCQAMRAANPNCKIGIFPEQRFNAWPKGNWRAIHDRLMKAITFAETGAATYYRDAQSLALARACRMGGPPQSSEELFSRMDFEKLRAHFPRKELEGLKKEHVEAMTMRLMSLREDTGSVLDGGWSCPDVDAAYFGLNTLVFGESVGTMAHMLLSHIAYYAMFEKERGRPLVVVIDEYSSLSGVRDVHAFIKQIRKLGVYVILISQTVADMGDFDQAQSMVNTVGTVFAHSSPDWAALSKLIGVELTPEVTWQYGVDGGAELDRVRHVESPKVKPDDLLGLGVGDLFAFRGNTATKIKILPPDQSGYEEFEWPEQEELYEPFEYALKDEAERPHRPGFLSSGVEPARFNRSRFEIPDDLPGAELPSSDEDPSGSDDEPEAPALG